MTNKADRAKNLLIDDFFTEEMQKLRDSCISSIINSRPDDYDVREDSYRKIRVLDEIRAHFEGIAAESQMTEKRWKIL